MKHTKKITILHSNDLHGDFLAEQVDEKLVGGVSMLSGYIEKVRAEEPNTIYAIAGDMFRGSVIDSEYKGLSTIEIMNALAPDIVTIGNHEVDYGIAHLLFIEKCARFPIINANLYIKNTPTRLFTPYKILRVDGMNILFIGIITERLAEDDCKNGYILDGVPRTIAQAEAIETMGIRIDKVLELSVADDVIVERMSGRRVCEKCGASYHIINKKSKVEGVCDLCGGKTVIRKDDQPATVLDRLKAYHEQTEPLVEFYRTRGKLAEIKFCPSIEETTAEVMKALEA